MVGCVFTACLHWKSTAQVTSLYGIYGFTDCWVSLCSVSFCIAEDWLQTRPYFGTEKGVSLLFPRFCILEIAGFQSHVFVPVLQDCFGVSSWWLKAQACIIILKAAIHSKQQLSLMPADIFWFWRSNKHVLVCVFCWFPLWVAASGLASNWNYQASLSV